MSPTPPKKQAHQLCKTGLEGLDDILAGGLPRDRIFLLLGDPGSGKTTLALQFLLEGQKLGEKGLYITLSETADELNEVATSHHWDLTELEVFELSAMQEHLKSESETTFFSPSEVELSRTIQVLLDMVEATKPARIVFDSLSEIRLMAETPLRYRRQILALKQFFSGRSCTVLLLDDRAGTKAVDEQVESLAHGVITLVKNAPDYGILRRQIRVEKMRGVKFREGNHDIIMETGGLIVFPRLVAAEHRTGFKHESLLTGIQELDTLLGGGIDRGTSNVVLGPAGAGKSTLALTFIAQAAKRGEKAMYFTFDEVRATMLHRADNMGLGMSDLMTKGVVSIHQIDPAEISPGELAFKIKHAVMNEGVTMVVIDSLNGYVHSMPDQRHLLLQLHELLAFLNQQGVVTLLILAQQGIIGATNSPIDLTYLADTVILMRFFEAEGRLRQMISVMKKRSGNHERAIREFCMQDGKITIEPSLVKFRALLTGYPAYNSEPKSM